MYGLILVEPEGGLPPVDREYYVVQGDFYTKGPYGEPGSQPFDMQKAIDEDADYVVFNGKVGALTGDGALQANVGETVRLFVGNGGPNLVSSFHVIGEIFDKVYMEGGDRINRNVQTTLIPAGGSAIVEFKVEVPSNLVLVDHSIFRAFNKGALGLLTVSGDLNPTVFQGEINEGIYMPEGGAIQELPVETAPAGNTVARTVAERVDAGRRIYSQSCMACHMTNGEGLANVFPPLAASDYLNADPNRAIRTILHGLSGEVTVNGVKYNNIMPAQVLSDEQVANVLTFVYQSWGNKAQEITPAMVASQRTKK
jgi:nitrite reductase (NO-forming)